GTTESVRDFGRGIPLGKVVDCVSKINTGAKYNDDVFQFSVGLNGVGTKAVNALSKEFLVRSHRSGDYVEAWFKQGKLKNEKKGKTNHESDGTFIRFEPDPDIFKKVEFRPEFVEKRLRHYSYLNTGLKLIYNGTTFQSRDGLRECMVGAVSLRLKDPVFESQTKNKLGNTEIRSELVNKVREELLHFFHRNKEIAEKIIAKVEDTKQLRKELQEVKKLARERARAITIRIPQLKDCKIHFDKAKGKGKGSMVFITEGQSAAGSIVSCRDVNTQAIFVLKGKPLNVWDLKRDIVYKS